MTEAPGNPASDRILRAVVDIFLVLSAAIVCIQLLRDLLAGGNIFRQGDYLINSLVEPVRRGLMGSALLRLSDVTGLHVITLVCALQLAAVITLYLSFRHIVAGTGRPDVSTLLAISPAIFVMFWFGDPPGSGRKELLAFAGLCAIAAATISGRGLLLALGTVFFVLAILSHEAMVLLLPTLFAVLWLTDRRDGLTAPSLLLIATVLSAAAVSLIYTYLHLKVQDIGSVCRPLVERGFSESFCDGAIVWVRVDLAFGIEEVQARLDLRSGLEVAGMYIAAMLPFAYLAWRQARRARAFLVVAATAAPFVPLYFVAIDWGRWMSLHVFSLTLIFALAFRSGRMSLSSPVARWQLCGFLALAAVVSPWHIMGIQRGGAALILFQHLTEAASWALRVATG